MAFNDSPRAVCPLAQSHQTEPRCLAFPWLSLGWPIRGLLAGAARRVISLDCRSALSLLPLVWPMVPWPAQLPSRQSPCQMMSTSSVGEPRHCYYHFTWLQPRPSAGLRVCQSVRRWRLAALLVPSYILEVPLLGRIDGRWRAGDYRARCNNRAKSLSSITFVCL